jgi:hypothetical protein
LQKLQLDETAFSGTSKVYINTPETKTYGKVRRRRQCVFNTQKNNTFYIGDTYIRDHGCVLAFFAVYPKVGIPQNGEFFMIHIHLDFGDTRLFQACLSGFGSKPGLQVSC